MRLASHASAGARRRALAVVAACAAAAAGLTSLSAAPASATGAAGVTILSPDANATVSGDVQVRVHLVTPDSGVFTELDVEIDHARVTMPLNATTAPGCDVECDLTVSVPTGGWSPPSPDPAAPPSYDGDGSFTLVASATNTFATWSDSRIITLDNHRPVVTALDLPPVTGAFDDMIGLTAQNTLTVRADAGTTGGPDVTAVQLILPSALAGQPGTVNLTHDPDGHWSGQLDTSAYGDGYYLGYIAAFDANGTGSVAKMVPFVVDRQGLRLSFSPPPVVQAGTSMLSVAASDGGKPTTWPVSYALRVDDTTVYTTDARSVWQHPMSWGRVLPPVDVASGPHQIGWEVLDNRGAISSVTRTVTLDAGPAVTLSPSSAVRGELVDVVAGLAAVSGADIRWWRVETIAPSGRDTQLTEGTCTASCPQVQTLRVETSFDEAGTWQLRVEATDSDGALRDTTRTIVVGAPTTTRLVSSTAAPTYGSSVRLTATVLRDGAALSGATVRLQFRPNGSSVWSTRATATTTSTGRLSWTTTPTGSGTWRAVTRPKAGAWGGSIGSVAVAVRARVRLMSAPSTVTRGRTATWVWDADPYEPGVRLWVQVRRPGGSWVTVAKPLVSTTGAASAGLTFWTRGTWYVRAVRPSTQRVVTALWSTTRWVN